jgi:ABC-2 type transport system permease protein
MGSAFWFLMRRSARNRLIRQMDRLKEPRYAVALLVGLGYIWFFLVSQQPRPSGSNPVLVTLVPLLGSLGLFVAVVRWWLFGADRRALSFTPAEIQFLFPAPVTRRALIRWKLLRWQILIGINALIWIIIARKTRPPIPMIFYFVAIWAVFSTLSLHRLGAALARAQVGVHWRSGLRRQAIPIVLASLATAGILTVVVSHWPELSGRCCGPAFWSHLETVFQDPIATVVLLPFQLLMAPVGATSMVEWGRAMVPAAAILLLHYAWVMKSQVAFEEASVQASAEVAQRLARRKSGRRPLVGQGRLARGFLPLAPTGWPGTAILWKNLIAVTRGVFSRSLLIGLGVMVAALAAVVSSEENRSVAGAVGTGALAMAGVLAFLGPSWIRNDLRQDLSYLGLLRSYPLRGKTIVLAEIAASTLTLTALQALLLIVGSFGLENSSELPRNLPPAAFLGLALPAILVMNAVGLSVQNAAALLFPAWVRFDPTRAGGFESLGQNILSALFTLFLTLLALAGPVVTAWLIWTATLPMLGPWAALPAAAGALGLTVLEFGFLLNWLGRVFERTESTT